MNNQIAVTKDQYLYLSDKIDQHSRTLIQEKGEEYSLDVDFLAMENRLAGLSGLHPAVVSIILASKHIAAMFVILRKNDVEEIKMKGWDERVRDLVNLIKISSAFVHAEHGSFDLSL